MSCPTCFLPSIRTDAAGKIIPLCPDCGGDTLRSITATRVKVHWPRPRKVFKKKGLRGRKHVSIEERRLQGKARYAANKAQKDGILVPQPCKYCGQNDRHMHKHHPDYSKPLDVEWLCVSCHCRLHIKQDEHQRDVEFHQIVERFHGKHFGNSKEINTLEEKQTE